ncbi:MAG: hypothetical protein CVU87_02930 [Firmicutes bacterium HGW-Firmicutes-12]|nr:MAG: hypothetical protein CVU87_02930 [Firmicutes bacterium HGW-Firmicutes-12]
MNIFVIIVVLLLFIALLTKKYIARKRKERLIFNLYLNMFELYGYYYWLVMSGNKQKQEIEEKVKTLVRMVMTDMNKIKNLPFTQKARELLLCDEKKSNISTIECYHNLEKMLQLLEEYINKKHRRVIKRIASHKFKNEENMPGDAKKRGELFNAPGFIDWKPRREGRYIKR